LESLSSIADFIREVSTTAGLDKKTFYNLRLAVDEIATNVILHGYQKAGVAGDIKLTADIEDDTLTILLEDTAPAYDPRETHTEAQDALDETLEERPVGGLGIYLALKSVDQFRYERIHGRNRNFFVMNRKQPRAE
jgi:anti-sigma regulatory factor (Ser/Thr protein kinase)